MNETGTVKCATLVLDWGLETRTLHHGDKLFCFSFFLRPRSCPRHTHIDTHCFFPSMVRSGALINSDISTFESYKFDHEFPFYVRPGSLAWLSAVTWGDVGWSHVFITRPSRGATHHTSFNGEGIMENGLVMGPRQCDTKTNFLNKRHRMILKT